MSALAKELPGGLPRLVEFTQALCMLDEEKLKGKKGNEKLMDKIYKDVTEERTSNTLLPHCPMDETLPGPDWKTFEEMKKSSKTSIQRLDKETAEAEKFLDGLDQEEALGQAAKWLLANTKSYKTEKFDV
ncbi:hypothetical protein H2200_010912 [Cladophialophora chaetospira]|uniref:Uncharacterized protein n=1 Tax=Cladophialophora chaetospira TaxID=386627 RepID=A0AA38X100_9EURO|nr:hypothetical protein H2200_010912 [Cladophialophora chaetospira]